MSDKKNNFNDSRTLNPTGSEHREDADKPHGPPDSKSPGSPEQDPKRRLGSFGGAGEHPRTEQMGQPKD